MRYLLGYQTRIIAQKRIENQAMKRYAHRVRYFETDRMGYVYHSRYFHWFEIARAELMRDAGISYHDLEQKGFFLPVVECGCRYSTPFHYDDQVHIEVSLTELKRTIIRFRYVLHNDKDHTAAEGFTRHVCVTEDGKPVKIPNEFNRILQHLVK